MSRRASLPGASELFRLTSSPATPALERPAVPAPAEPVSRKPAARADTDELARNAARSGSGRTKHDAKITVYLSDEELLALEHARLALRAAHGIAVDRGRVVRAAIAAVLDDFRVHGADSQLVKGITGDD